LGILREKERRGKKKSPGYRQGRNECRRIIQYRLYMSNVSSKGASSNVVGRCGPHDGIMRVCARARSDWSRGLVEKECEVHLAIVSKRPKIVECGKSKVFPSQKKEEKKIIRALNVSGVRAGWLVHGHYRLAALSCPRTKTGRDDVEELWRW